MKYGICTLALVPLRSEQAHRSEMVSQVLFGELFEILDEQSDWSSIRLLDTGYTGWIQNGQFTEISNVELARYTGGDARMVGREGGMLTEGSRKLYLCHGTKLYFDEQGGFDLEGNRWHYQGTMNTLSRTDFSASIAALARSYQDAPYLWGGRSQWGIDCSGFSQLIYSCFGIQLPRDAYQQAEMGQTVDFVAEIKVGDLAFFDNEAGRITHVGIMLDTDTIIHASARVRVDRMDNEGIYNRELNKYSHKLRIVKRYL